MSVKLFSEQTITVKIAVFITILGTVIGATVTSTLAFADIKNRLTTVENAQDESGLKNLPVLSSTVGRIDENVKKIAEKLNVNIQ